MEPHPQRLETAGTSAYVRKIKLNTDRIFTCFYSPPKRIFTRANLLFFHISLKRITLDSSLQGTAYLNEQSKQNVKNLKIIDCNRLLVENPRAIKGLRACNAQILVVN